MAVDLEGNDGASGHIVDVKSLSLPNFEEFTIPKLNAALMSPRQCPEMVLIIPDVVLVAVNGVDEGELGGDPTVIE